MASTDHYLNSVKTERERQDQKWGQQDHDSERWMLILAEEMGEAAKDVLENNESSLRAELIQVAAVALAWLEALDRKVPTWRRLR